jgi:pyruvate formate lyase activating enzyme
LVCSARTIENGILAFEREECIKCGKCTEACLNDANEIIGKEMTSSEVLNEVLKDKMFYDTSGGGLTVSGGEPSHQPDFTLEILKRSKESGISLAIETCGIGSRDFYKKVADLGTTFLFDIKCLDPARHKELTGADNAHIISNLRYLMDRYADIIIRLTLVPDCNDSDEDIAKLSDFLNANKGRYRYAEIMPYHTLGIGKAEKLGTNATYIHDSATDEEISRWTSLFKSHNIDIKVSK